MQAFFTFCQLFVIFLFSFTIVANLKGEYELISQINAWVVKHKSLNNALYFMFWVGVVSALFSIL